MSNSCEHTSSPDDELLEKQIAQIKKTLVILSGKGGVGKSTVAVNLALSLALRGFHTGLLDVDICGPSIPKLLHLGGEKPNVTVDGLMPVEHYSNLKVMSMGFLLQNDDQPVIWRGPMKGTAIKQFLSEVVWGELDYLVVDCPPGTGDEPLSVAQLLKEKSSAVIVTTPQEVATVDVAKCVTFCNQLAMPIAGIIENMSGFVCPHCNGEVDIFSSGGGQRLANRLGVPFLGRIPIDPAVVKSGDEGEPYVYFYPKTKTASRFEEIVVTITKNGHLHEDVQTRSEASDGQDVARKGDAMRFAIPTNNGTLCQHFGHCKAFALIDVEGDRIVNETYVDAPEHQPGLLPEWLGQKGVNWVIAGGIGSRAKDLFAARGINVVAGAQGQYPREIVERFLNKTLETGVNTCDH